jgi:site-specific recombinase
MRIIVFVLNAVIQLAAAAVGFLLLLLGLNGFSERQSNPSLLFYITLSVGSAAGLGVASAFASKWLAGKKSLGGLGASAIAVVGFAIVGVLILVVGFFVALFIASAMRGSR